MPLVDLNDGNFERCQKHAVPLVDTINDVIARALDALDEIDDIPIPKPSGSAKVYDPASPPNLLHTVPRFMSVEGVEILKERYWSTLLAEIIKAAGKQGASPGEIVSTLQTPAAKGKSTGAGYQFVPEAGVSFQQLNSSRTWKECYRLAKRWDVPVEVRWIWLEKEGAFAPGAAGTFKVG